MSKSDEMILTDFLTIFFVQFLALFFDIVRSVLGI